MMHRLPSSLIRQFRAVGAFIALAGSAITCMDAPTRAAANRSYVSATTRSTMSKAEIAALRVRAFSSARVTVTQGGSVVATQTFSFSPGSGDRTESVTVPNMNAGVEVQVDIDLIDATGTIVWDGTPATTTTTTGPTGGTPAQVTLLLNPASLVASITPFAPGFATSFPAAGGSISMSAIAYDENTAQMQVGGYVWSVSDPSVADISSTGVLSPKKAGTVRVTATAAGISGSVTITFTAAPAFSQLSVTSGSGQTATVGQAATQAFTVQAKNTVGDPVSGQVVTFSASTGASISPTSVTTGATGNASATMTVGNTPGTYTFTATSNSSTGPVTQQVTVNAVAGSASTVAAVGATSQSAAAGSTVTFTVKVTDAQGNALTGTTVTWARTSGSGTPSTSSSSTSSAGVASLSYTLGSATGTETVTASVAGVSSPVTFTVTKTAGAAANMTAPGGTSFTFKQGQQPTSTPSVLITDANNNPVAGVVVTANLYSGTFQIASQNLTSAADGKVTTDLSAFAASAQPGTYTVVATATGLTGSPITFTITVTP
jgi:hypothetical protein